MKLILTWSSVLVLGLTALIVYPTLAQAAAGDGPSGAAVILVPLGFLAAMSGAVGLFLTWCLAYRAPQD